MYVNCDASTLWKCSLLRFLDSMQLLIILLYNARTKHCNAKNPVYLHSAAEHAALSLINWYILMDCNHLLEVTLQVLCYGMGVIHNNGYSRIFLPGSAAYIVCRRDSALRY